MADMEALNAEQQGAQRQQSAERKTSALPPLPPDALIILPVRDMVLFPGMVMPVTVGRPRSLSAAQQAVREQRPVGILMQRDAEVAEPGELDMHRVGTAANIVRYITAPDGTNHVALRASSAFRSSTFRRLVIPGRRACCASRA